jgi:Lrp/AsnC family transcriptional regulator, leucine-responsive regulatory protein
MARREKNFISIDRLSEENDFNKKLGLDDRDNIILSLVQSNPNISQVDIANKIKLSQPSVGARIKKLQQKGILYNVAGVNFKIVNLHLAKVEVNTTDPSAILKEFMDCPFFVNGFIISGRYNLSLLFMSTDLRRLENIVNFHLRDNPKVKEVELNIVISTVKDFILPLNVNYSQAQGSQCKMKCGRI